MKKITNTQINPTRITFQLLSKRNWDKFTELFGERGACGNCWCMSYRLSRPDFDKGKERNGNKNRMKKLVWSGQPTGLMAFYKGEAIGWCALAPREDFIRIENSRIHKRIDDQPVWSIPCFFIDKKFRKQGLSVLILKAVIEYAKKKKIRVLEAYPIISTWDKLPDTFAWWGLLSSFEKAGFEIVSRTSKNHPMVRYYND